MVSKLRSLQLAGLLAQRLQPVGRLDLAQLPVPGFAAQPAQEAADRGAVAAMGAADALQLDGVLAGLGQRHRIGVAHQRHAGRLQAGRRPYRRRRALDQHALAHLAQHVEGGSELVGRRQGHGVAQPGQGAVGHLAAVHEEVDMAVAVQQREAQRERRARHVAAAHVQQPGDRIGGGDQRHVGALGLDGAGDARCAWLRCSRRRIRRDAAAPAPAAPAAGRATPRRRDWNRPARIHRRRAGRRAQSARGRRPSAARDRSRACRPWAGSRRSTLPAIAPGSGAARRRRCRPGSARRACSARR